MHSSKRRTSARVYLVLIHLFLLLVLVKSDFLDRVYKSLGGTFARVERSPDIEPARNRLRIIDSQAVEGNRVVLLGDSNLNLVDAVAISPRVLQLSLGGDTARMMSERISDYRSLRTADAAVLAIGQNDLLFRPAAEVPGDIEMVLLSIPDQVPVVLSAILPVDEALAPKEKRNAVIRKINVALASQCAARTAACQFVDVTPLLTDRDGRLRRNMHVGDGVHLSASGSILWVKEIKRALNAFQ